MCFHETDFESSAVLLLLAKCKRTRNWSPVRRLLYSMCKCTIVASTTRALVILRYFYIFVPRIIYEINYNFVERLFYLKKAYFPWVGSMLDHWSLVSEINVSLTNVTSSWRLKL